MTERELKWRDWETRVVKELIVYGSQKVSLAKEGHVMILSVKRLFERGCVRIKSGNSQKRNFELFRQFLCDLDTSEVL